MASLEQLFQLRNDSALKNKVTAAVIVATESIRANVAPFTDHANRLDHLAWAKSTLENPGGPSAAVFLAVLAANADQTVENIQSATDMAIKANVNTAIIELLTV